MSSPGRPTPSRARLVDPSLRWLRPWWVRVVRFYDAPGCEVRQHQRRLPGGRRFHACRLTVHLPSGLVTFLFTDIEGSTRLAQMLGPGYRPVLSEHRRLLRRTLADQRRRGAVHRGRLVLLRVRRRRGRADRLPRRAAGTGRPRLADTRRPGPGSGWACTPATPSRRRRVRQPRGAPRGPGRRRRARRPGALLRGHRRGAPTALPERRLAARPRPAPAARLRRPGAALPARRAGPGPAVPPAAHAGRGRAQPAHRGHLVRRPRGGAGRAAADCSPSTGWSPWSARAAPARPGSPSRSPRGQRASAYPDGVWFVDLAAVTDPGLVGVRDRRRARAAARAGPPGARHPRRVRRGRRCCWCWTPATRSWPPAPRWSPGCSPAARGVRVLATSREPLGLPGEVVWRIPPLSLDPAPGGGTERRGGAAAGPYRGGPRRPAAEPAEPPDLAPGRAAAGRPAAGDRAGRGPAAGALGAASSPTGCDAGS